MATPASEKRESLGDVWLRDLKVGGQGLLEDDESRCLGDSEHDLQSELKAISTDVNLGPVDVGWLRDIKVGTQRPRSSASTTAPIEPIDMQMESMDGSWIQDIKSAWERLRTWSWQRQPLDINWLADVKIDVQALNGWEPEARGGFDDSAGASGGDSQESSIAITNSVKDPLDAGWLLGYKTEVQKSGKCIDDDEPRCFNDAGSDPQQAAPTSARIEDDEPWPQWAKNASNTLAPGAISAGVRGSLRASWLADMEIDVQKLRGDEPRVFDDSSSDVPAMKVQPVDAQWLRDIKIDRPSSHVCIADDALGHFDSSGSSPHQAQCADDVGSDVTSVASCISREDSLGSNWLGAATIDVKRLQDKEPELRACFDSGSISGGLREDIEQYLKGCEQRASTSS